MHFTHVKDFASQLFQGIIVKNLNKLQSSSPCHKGYQLQMQVHSTNCLRLINIAPTELGAPVGRFIEGAL